MPSASNACRVASGSASIPPPADGELEPSRPSARSRAVMLVPNKRASRDFAAAEPPRGMATGTTSILGLRRWPSTVSWKLTGFLSQGLGWSLSPSSASQIGGSGNITSVVMSFEVRLRNTYATRTRSSEMYRRSSTIATSSVVERITPLGVRPATLSFACAGAACARKNAHPAISSPRAAAAREPRRSAPLARSPRPPGVGAASGTGDVSVTRACCRRIAGASLGERTVGSTSGRGPERPRPQTAARYHAWLGGHGLP